MNNSLPFVEYLNINRFKNTEIAPFQIVDVRTSGILGITVVARRKAEFVYKAYYGTASNAIFDATDSLSDKIFRSHSLLRAQIFHKKSHPQSTLLKVDRKPLMESLIK